MIKKYIHKILNWFARLFGFQPTYRTHICEDLPEHPEAYALYLIGEDQSYWTAAMICPCGCGDLLQLALDPRGRPRWDVRLDKKGLVTLHPSVHRKVSCRSHFFLRCGKVVWC